MSWNVSSCVSCATCASSGLIGRIRSAVRRARLLELAFELDPHAVASARPLEAGVAERPTHPLVLGPSESHDPLTALFADSSEAPVEGLSAKRALVARRDSHVDPVGRVRMRVDVGVADDLAIRLGDPDVLFQIELVTRHEPADVVLALVGLVEELCASAVEEPRDVWDVVKRGHAEIHAGTSWSSTSARPSRSGNSRSGFARSERSSSRLIQTLCSPSSSAGAMSWKRLAATWTWPVRSAPIRWKNSSQCPWAGL